MKMELAAEVRDYGRNGEEKEALGHKIEIRDSE